MYFKQTYFLFKPNILLKSVFNIWFDQLLHVLNNDHFYIWGDRGLVDWLVLHSLYLYVSYFNNIVFLCTKIDLPLSIHTKIKHEGCW